MAYLYNNELKTGTLTNKIDAYAVSEQSSCVVSNENIVRSNVSHSNTWVSLPSSNNVVLNDSVAVESYDNYNEKLTYTPKDFSCTFTGNCIVKDGNEIESIKIVVPEKVLWITFNDGFKTKMIRHEEDEFNIEKCLYIALAKKLYKGTYTFDGMLHMSEELSWYKYYEKIVKKGIKKYKDVLKEMYLTEEEEKRIIEKKRKSKLKKQKRLERKAKKETESLAKEREEMISILAEAIKKSKE